MSAASRADDEPRGDVTEPGGEVFSEADLEPSSAEHVADERRGRRRSQIDLAVTVVAVSAAGLWMGGMVALGACAAPMVFEHVPHPLSGIAMGTSFARFDSLAMGCMAVLLAAEMARTVLALRRRKGAMLARIRRYCAILLALGVVYTGVAVTPSINNLYSSGTRRNVGTDGSELERLHHQAELIGKLGLPLALVVLTLHLVTLHRREEENEYENFPAPLPPGPRP